MATHMPKRSKKLAYIGVSGLSPELMNALRERAKRNNRSLSGELRAIIAEAIDGEGNEQ
jgi:plasmid stability protein